MAHEVLVGVDVGTTSIKAIAVTPAGEIRVARLAGDAVAAQGPLADADPRVLADTVIAVCAEAADRRRASRSPSGRSG